MVLNKVEVNPLLMVASRKYGVEPQRFSGRTFLSLSSLKLNFRKSSEAFFNDYEKFLN